MTEMKDDLLNWALSQGPNLGFNTIISLKPLREQASLRSYFRIETERGTKIGVVSEQFSKENQLFKNHSSFLLENGLSVPAVEAYDHEKGLMILEDFGDKVLQLEINAENKSYLYKHAIKEVQKIQLCDTSPDLTILSKRKLEEQMKLFEKWFLSGFLNLEFSDGEKKLVHDSWKIISRECAHQNYATCHFDFEFRNLMLLPDNTIGILDFQDLCVGPYALDLVSILKDIENPLTRIELMEYMQFYINELKYSEGEVTLSIENLERDIDFAGFQRQFRILGTLSRLHLRDKKSFRLFDLIQTLKFLIEDSIKYDDLKDLGEFLKGKIQPRLEKTIQYL
jgi:hypothetical protein